MLLIHVQVNKKVWKYTIFKITMLKFFTGTSFGLPVIQIYKNGQRIDGMLGVRTEAQLQNLIVKNGGYNSKLIKIFKNFNIN